MLNRSARKASESLKSVMKQKTNLTNVNVQVVAVVPNNKIVKD